MMIQIYGNENSILTHAEMAAGADDGLVDLETLRGRAVLENRGAQVNVYVCLCVCVCACVCARVRARDSVSACVCVGLHLGFRIYGLGSSNALSHMP